MGEDQRGLSAMYGYLWGGTLPMKILPADICFQACMKLTCLYYRKANQNF